MTNTKHVHEVEVTVSTFPAPGFVGIKGEDEAFLGSLPTRSTQRDGEGQQARKVPDAQRGAVASLGV